MKLGRIIFVAAAFSAVCLLSSESFAGNPIRKLGRGVANAAFCPLEVPLQVYDVNKEEGGISAVTYGVFKGIAYCVARAGVGVIDIVTCPMPLPGCPDDPRDEGWGYGAIMRPEWIIDPEHNAYNIFYQDTLVTK